MRRLTLVLSDLYLPTGAGAEELAPRAADSDTVAMPNFAWLMRFAAERQHVGDWRRRVAALAGIEAAGLAPAQIAAIGHVSEERRAGCWFATPVHLEARLDHVRLARHGLLRLGADQRQMCCEEFARGFGPELALHDDGPRGFLLSGLEAVEAHTADPARLLGADIGSALPRGAASGAGTAALRKLSTEIEMWLHGTAMNRERERAREPAVSALWLWGGGGAAPAADIPRRTDLAYAGEDSWLAAVARLQTGEDLRTAPAHFGQLESGAMHGFVELPAMSVTDGLERLDRDWLGPARNALARGELQQLDLLANDEQFTIRRHAGWRLWRRGRHWLDLLRDPSRTHGA